MLTFATGENLNLFCHKINENIYDAIETEREREQTIAYCVEIGANHVFLLKKYVIYN